MNINFYVGILLLLFVDISFALKWRNKSGDNTLNKMDKIYYPAVVDEDLGLKNSADVSDESVQEEEGLSDENSNDNEIDSNNDQNNDDGNNLEDAQEENVLSDEKPDNNEISDDFDQTDNNEDNQVYVCTDEKDSICNCETYETLNCEKQDLVYTNLNIADDQFVIKYANFKNNAIRTLKEDEILPGYFEVVELDFSNNFIDTIEDRAFDEFLVLKKLHLSSNRLTTISRGYLTEKVGTSLHQLFLDDNQIIKIPASAFSELWNLEKLVLDRNMGLKLSRKTFPTALMNLEILSLDRCGISALDDDVFERLTSLKQLSLRENPLTYIPRAINAVPNLVGLDLSGTEITELLTDEISADHNLVEIYLSNLKYLFAIYDCAFCSLPNLKKVDMSNNTQLYKIHDNAFGYITKQDDPSFPVAFLKDFYINSCNFEYLPEKLFDWTKIKTLKIHQNPFNCNCDLAWLVNNNKNIHFEINPRCASPDFLKGTYFSNLTNSVCGGKIPASIDFFTSTQSSPTSDKLSSFKWVTVAVLTIIGILGLVVSGFLLYCLCRARRTTALRRSETSHSEYSILPTTTK